MDFIKRPIFNSFNLFACLILFYFALSVHFYQMCHSRIHFTYPTDLIEPYDSKCNVYIYMSIFGRKNKVIQVFFWDKSQRKQAIQFAHLFDFKNISHCVLVSLVIVLKSITFNEQVTKVHCNNSIKLISRLWNNYSIWFPYFC